MSSMDAILVTTYLTLQWRKRHSMPELPEVEVTTRGLRPHLVGSTLYGTWFSGKKLRQAVPINEIEKEVFGQQICSVTRRAKFVQIELGNGALMVIHLGMTGNLGIFPEKSMRRLHDHLEWQLDGGRLLRLHDPRRFGAVYFYAAEEVEEGLKALYATTGPEPLGPDFSVDYLMTKAKGRQLSVKQFLMTNQIVAGIGNIYANEALHTAGIAPATRVSRIGRKRWQRLVTAIQETLLHAIDCGGSTISDYLSVGQQRGYFQINFKVYGRDGQPCHCGTTIKKRVLGGRASYWCPSCQH
jgi:formamidopyrimidine-DNA glycosylase